MPIEISYICDHSGKACSDADVLADQTGATQRVVLDATVYHLSGGVVKASAMGQHVFASMDDALQWAQGIQLK